MENKQEEMVISDNTFNDQETPPVVEYNDANANKIKLADVEPDLLILNTAVKTTDFYCKFKIFMDAYKDTMEKIRKENSKKWKEILEETKKNQTQSPFDEQLILEVMVVHMYEYSCRLKEEKEFSPLVTMFNEYLDQLKNPIIIS